MQRMFQKVISVSFNLMQFALTDKLYKETILPLIDTALTYEFDELKRTLILTQLIKVARLYPEDEIHFTFIDDKLDILEAMKHMVQQAYQDESLLRYLPKNIHIQFIQFNRYEVVRRNLTAALSEYENNHTDGLTDKQWKGSHQACPPVNAEHQQVFLQKGLPEFANRYTTSPASPCFEFSTTPPKAPPQAHSKRKQTDASLTCQLLKDAVKSTGQFFSGRHGEYCKAKAHVLGKLRQVKQPDGTLKKTVRI